MTKLRIECVRARDIEAFARREAEASTQGLIVPMSSSRARAWAANPHTEPGDVVLIVARLDGRCAGYLGLLPGRLWIRDRVEKVNWLSTFFVPEALRDQAIGGLLLMRAISLGRTLAAIESSDEAQRTYRAVGFASPRELSYFKLDMLRKRNWLGLPLRAVRRTLQLRNWKVPGALNAAIAGCAHAMAYLLLTLLLAVAQRRFGRWHAQPLEHLPQAKRPAGGGAHFVRDRALLEWMLNYPWVTTNRAEQNTGYYFDDFREEYFHRVFEVRKESNKEPAGWVILWFDVRMDRRQLHVLDYELDDSVEAEALLVVALREAARCGANHVFVPEVCALALVQLGPLGRLFSEERRRSYYRPRADSAARGLLDEIRLHYADGDIGFA